MRANCSDLGNKSALKSALRATIRRRIDIQIALIPTEKGRPYHALLDLATVNELNSMASLHGPRRID